MTIHICKGLYESTGASNFDNNGLYWIALFLRYVMNFTVVGQTNFNIEGSTLLKGSGTGASINIGTLNEFAVRIPSAQYTISSSDIYRVLILRSTQFPRQNSGMYRIVSVNTVENIAYIEYSASSYPPAEYETLAWAIIENEGMFSFNTGANAVSGGYRSNGAATCSRIILESNHSTGWQVRLCKESTTDVTNGLPDSTVAPGFGGNSIGDFEVGGQHLHHFLWRNVSNTTYRHTTPSVDMNTTRSTRYWIWGDDDTGSIVFVARTMNADQSTTNTLLLCFGLAEDESMPLPPLSVQRLFAAGTMASANENAINITSDYGTTFQGGSAFGLGRQPVSCCYSTYASLTGQNLASNSPRLSSSANDNSFEFTTELWPVDLIAGTYDNYVQSNDSDSVLPLEVRRIGRVPMLRVGRSPATWSPSGDMMWFVTTNGVWLPWGGQPPSFN